MNLADFRLSHSYHLYLLWWKNNIMSTLNSRNLLYGNMQTPVPTHPTLSQPPLFSRTPRIRLLLPLPPPLQLLLPMSNLPRPPRQRVSQLRHHLVNRLLRHLHHQHLPARVPAPVRVRANHPASLHNKVSLLHLHRLSRQVLHQVRAQLQPPAHLP